MQELLYLYGFVIDDNTDDYLMVMAHPYIVPCAPGVKFLFIILLTTNQYYWVLQVHYPAEAINTISFSESKSQLLEVQVY